jgi:diguanylate cyclase (GGDEF)-like protein/PAS domain S-box-containing protein
MSSERHALILLENLTAEKKQILLSKKHSAELRKAHESLEVKVKERTAELLNMIDLMQEEIRKREDAESNLRLAANVIESSNEAIMITDVDATIIEVNDAFCRVTGYPREEVVGKNPRCIGSGHHDAAFWKKMWETLHSTGHWQGEVWNRRKNGEIFPELLSISVVKHENNAVNYVGIFSDITRIKQTEKHLERLAHYDPLTGLANRILFRARLDQAILKADRSGERIAVMMLDLDDFKKVNDTLGHPMGDALLSVTAKRIADSVRKIDTVARLGGDEFGLVLESFAEIRSLDFISSKILLRVSEPYSLAEQKVFIGASIGIALYPDDGRDVDVLLRNADTAMYHTKKHGKNRVSYFSSEMNRRARHRMTMETRLREAIENSEFELHYQPQVNLVTGNLVGCEALVRWRHKSRGLIPPGEFITIAEETGLITQIGNWVLRTACGQIRLWKAQGFPEFPVSVNLSGVQIRSERILENIIKIVRGASIDPRLLELEMTETVLMHDRDRAVELLRQLKRHGLALAIDDFGTGYSSMAYLKQFPVDKLKIDRSFIEDLATDKGDKAIVNAIIAMARSLNLKVIAEGVETKVQAELLRSYGCSEVQGYYFGKPMPVREFDLFVKQRSRG